MTTILVVEDNEINCDMLSRRIARRGYNVVTAPDGAQAVEVATREIPDLILMDMSLPIIDGWEATRRIKNAPQTSHIPIIALTAHIMDSAREKSLAAGCDDYDTKPVRFGQLMGKIQALLDH